MSEKRIRIIVNPISGRGRAGRTARALQAALVARGFGVEILETHAQGDARRFAAGACGFHRIVCIGGDGTVSEVVNGLPIGHAPPLAGVPGGTGNAYAKELRLPSGIEALADLIGSGSTVCWDIGINRSIGRRFMMFAGAGFQAEVVRHFQAHRHGPSFKASYLRWGFHVASRFPLPRITVEVDGRIAGRDIPWVEVFNISHYGGPLRIAPQARPSDGMFDILILRSRRIRDIWRLLGVGLYTFAFDSPWRLKEMEFVNGRRVRLTSEGRAPIHMDGDFQGYLPADLEVLPWRVEIVSPQVNGSTARTTRAV